MKRVNPLPTILTLCNMISGFGSMTLAMRAAQCASDPAQADFVARMHQFAVLLIFLGMVFDVLDGRVARMAKLTSRFGAELDSLSDIVTFGVAPALLAKSLMDVGNWPAALVRVGWVMLALYVAAAAVRLARYNVEAISPADGSVGKKGKDYFVGLPSPAAAGLAGRTVLVYFFLIGKDDGLGIKKRWAEWVTLGLPVLMLGLGWLMISRVRYMHVGNRIFSGRKRLVPVMLVLVAVVLLVGFPQLVGMLFFGTYVLGFLFWDLGRRARSARVRRRLRGRGAHPERSDEVPETPADGTGKPDVPPGAGDG